MGRLKPHSTKKKCQQIPHIKNKGAGAKTKMVACRNEKPKFVNYNWFIFETGNKGAAESRLF